MLRAVLRYIRTWISA